MKRQFRAGLIAAVLGLLSFAPISHATANDTIDPVVTGSVEAGAAPAADARGSAAFRAALDVLLGGDPAAAYTQARTLPDAVERRTIQWAAIYFNAGKIDYQSVQRFAVDAPDFAAASTYRMRIEQSLTKAEAAPEAVIAALGGGTMPRTIDGQINRLRRTIERDPANPVWLQTVRGVGYRLSVE